MLMLDPKISVIIPIYNVEKYIPFSFETLVNQTLKDVEFICIIDGSIDNSPKLVEQFASTDQRIYIIYQENQGAAIAKNNGLKLARGEYVAFFDPDDFLPKRYTLELMYKTAKANFVKICGGSLIEINNGFHETPFSSEKRFAKNSRIRFNEYQYCYHYQRFIYDRNFLLRNNLFFPEFRRFEDPIWFVKTMNTAGEFIAIQEPTYVYRVTNNSITRDKTNLIHSIQGWRSVITYSHQNELWDLYRFLLHDLNNDGWKMILKNGYNLYPNELREELKPLVSGLDYSVFQNAGLSFQLNDFLSIFKPIFIPEMSGNSNDLNF